MAENKVSVTMDDILNVTPMGLMMINRRGKVLCCNHKMATMFGLTVKELNERSINELFPKSSDEVMEVIKSTRQAAGLFVSELGGCFVQALPLPRDNDIWAIYVYDQRFWQSQLGEGPTVDPLTPYYKTIFDSSSDGISIADNKGRLILVNEASARHVGVPKEELQGKHVASMVERGLTDDYVSLEVIRDKKPVTRIIKFHKSGKHILLTGTPILNLEGQVHLVVINERDLTTMLELETNLKTQKEILDRVKAELAERDLAEVAQNQVVALSVSMKRTMDTAIKLSQHEVSPILITGESGTGKGLLAKFIHACSKKSKEPFIHINCAALPEFLLEAELFGYEKGAFTGANASGRAGLFEVSGNGTAFLDEIAEMSLPLQSKLLTFLDNRQFRRLAGHKTITATCTIIAATNQNLDRLVAEGRFRKDLYYRLNAFSINIPPLRERPEDILELARLEVEKLCSRFNLKRELDPLAFEILRSHVFPGNVRELLNSVSQAVVLSDGPQLGPFLAKTLMEEPPNHEPLKTASGKPFSANGHDLKPKKPSDFLGPFPPTQAQPPENEGSPLRYFIEETEMANLIQAVKRCRTTREMAEFLGISQAGVSRKLKKYGLKPPRNKR
ncbi:MAG: sigma 54-interacting transcriptional regulator [Deltaproteobacteria bacterium]|jgi:PAS domain S-box-containing protein|nr:sigma 54-interacting transcriptional regulator [Deltaproteobacteria bacterium]